MKSSRYTSIIALVTVLSLAACGSDAGFSGANLPGGPGGGGAGGGGTGGGGTLKTD
ncbi:MAG: hypothetical protein AAF417_02765 [Pseudomonadota bacterium]